MLIELERFLLTANEGSITRTAEKIFITQSALTQSIQRLEKELGTKLFIQKGKYLQLTDEGKDIQIITSKMLTLWQHAKDPKLRKIQLQTLSIGMFDNAALQLGSFIQSQIHNDSYHLELTIESSSSLISRLAMGTLDAALCVLSDKTMLPKHMSLVETFSEELLPVSSKRFSQPIATIPFIFYNKHSHTREQTDSVFEKNAIKPTIFAESTSATFMKELARLGSGVALLPKNYIQSELQQGILKRQTLPLQWERSYGLFINTDSELHKSHPFIKDILKALQQTK